MCDDIRFDSLLFMRDAATEEQTALSIDLEWKVAQLCPLDARERRLFRLAVMVQFLCEEGEYVATHGSDIIAHDRDFGVVHSAIEEWRREDSARTCIIVRIEQVGPLVFEGPKIET